MEEHIGERGGKVEDDLDGNGEGPRLCGVVGYCWRLVFLGKLKAKKAKKMTCLS